MASEAKHTPLPWIYDEVKTSCGRCFRIGSSDQLAEPRKLGVPAYACLYDDYGFGENAAKANAELIVTAVNERADLLAKLEQYRKALEEIDLANKRCDRDLVMDLCAKALSTPEQASLPTAQVKG